MARADVINILYSKDKSPLEFNFDSLWIPSMYQYIGMYEIEKLYNITTSVKYSSKIEEKYKEINNIMTYLNFRKIGSGTNRVVYVNYDDTRFVAKISIDTIGLKDNWAEFKNQNLLKPFVTKMFEVSQCGTVGFSERVDPILNQLEFASMAGDIFDLLTKFIIGKYILEDIGTKYFMNWGIRKGFGPCLLDYPYVFELDGRKMYCTRPKIRGTKFPLCEGVIDYDDGFNNLVCTECGKEYFARDLSKKDKSKLNIILKGEHDMRVKVVDGNGRVVADPNKSSKTILPHTKNENINLYNNERMPRARLVGTINPVIPEETGNALLKEFNKPEVPINVEPIVVKVNLKEEPDIDVNINIPKSRLSSTPVAPESMDVIIDTSILTKDYIEKIKSIEPDISGNREALSMKNDSTLPIDKIPDVTKISIEEPEFKLDENKQDIEERKGLFVIYHHLEGIVHKFPFDKYEKADLKQKKDLKDFLFAEAKSYYIKNKIKWTKVLLEKIADDFIEKNYSFEDEDANIIINAYDEMNDEFENQRFQKMPKKKSSKLDDY